MKLGLTLKSKQFLSLLLGLSLGLAIFISPYQLHNNPASIFFTKTSAEHSTHGQHEHQQESQAMRCLRCVLYGFQVPESPEPFIIIFVVLGFLKISKPAEPFSFIAPSQTARAPPVSL